MKIIKPALKLKKFFSTNWILLLILLLSIFLRFSGINPGYPPYHSDEGITYSSAVEMIKNNNLDPERYDYPIITPLVNYIFFKFFFIPLSWFKYFVLHFPDIMDG